MWKCLLCGSDIDDDRPYHDRANHQKGCPMYLNTEELAEALSDFIGKPDDPTPTQPKPLPEGWKEVWGY